MEQHREQEGETLARSISPLTLTYSNSSLPHTRHPQYLLLADRRLQDILGRQRQASELQGRREAIREQPHHLSAPGQGRQPFVSPRCDQGRSAACEPQPQFRRE